MIDDFDEIDGLSDRDRSGHEQCDELLIRLLQGLVGVDEEEGG